MKKRIFLVSVIAVLFGNLKASYAVIPPDFIFNIGSQVVQIFSVMLVFLAAVFSAAYQLLKTKFHALKAKKVYFIGSIVAVIGISLVCAYFYADYKQQFEYDAWLVRSQEHDAEYLDQFGAGARLDALGRLEVEGADGAFGIDSDGDGLTDGDEITLSNTDPENNDTDGDGYLDKTEIDNGFDPLVAQETIEKDKVRLFIETYYNNIGSGNYLAAYNVSKKSVSYEIFRSWYTKITKVSVDNIIRIDDTHSSLELTLFEGDRFTRYGVLMEVALDNGEPMRVASSEVSVLGEEDLSVSVKTPELDDQPALDTSNEAESISSRLYVTNTEFKNIINTGAPHFILDAREDLEFENGYLPGSTHIRFADLRVGRWTDLPDDRPIIVLCWSGMRGKEVTKFLRSKGLSAKFLEYGASGWYQFGGEWVGNIKFLKKYTGSQYVYEFTALKVKELQEQGVVIVDSREKYKYNYWHIPGSISIPLMYTPTVNLEKTFAQVPPHSRIIVVCDAYTNCFDAKMTGVELEKHGHTFLGRFTEPITY